MPSARHVIGRDEDADVRLQSPSVSRRHAEIYRQGPIFAIRDLGSRNGTYVDGCAVAHAPLRSGQLLRIGDFIGIVSSAPAEDAADRVRELGPGLLGGPALAAVLGPTRRAANFDLPIVIQGETGTGKELVARAVHVWSGRPGPFYAVNCAALATSLADAELFGYRKGAFTGAVHAHLGHFRAAHGGTLFLDEIADLPLESQAKLLRAIEQREVLPIGENRAVAVDVRIVCATQSDLASAVERRTFRADLNARLSGHTCLLPPLRERRADVPALFMTFLARYAGGSSPTVAAKLIEALCLHQWPNNVRELDLLARSLIALHGHEPVLRRELLPQHLLNLPARRAPSTASEGERRSYELLELARALRRTNGNVAKAAAELGLSRQRVYRLVDGRSIEEFMNEYGAEQDAAHADAG